MNAHATNNAYRHTAARVRKHYDLRLSRTDYNRLQREIWKLLPVLDTLPARGTRLLVPYPLRGTTIRFIYCPAHRLIITALHSSAGPRRRHP
ncbi:hypothetical protein IHN63_02105 [Deinococcus sp. 6YEL10]|uniref:hypothetical protein n=1 Tax=Deinococcus sp. 6YEL10 TaxID=2745870 RepID=UPI001E32F766|nr:hypothetical protein [Deinococcus sp. 6YEL10]MCD0160093.1 hypothetical protein [Deinococcus sp. 6YEL10]